MCFDIFSIADPQTGLQLKPVRIPFGCISILHFTDFSDFSSFGYKFMRIPNLYYL